MYCWSFCLYYRTKCFSHWFK
ncbi:hypothetical protein CY0110_16482 [Crocosphaera chwakensis CCY0110]|uniref:Uncharacterized protein n=1 Tax=Crocosphaera chwakensis CCY0110 TaxID=391612 RepID=A3IHX8_9CHRO|nr:hypothetical protein CY0110_16482 [Crocosphaera chwakensis CCY0110]